MAFNEVYDKHEHDTSDCIDSKCLQENGDRGRTGKGLSEKTMNESLSDFNQGVDITE